MGRRVRHFNPGHAGATLALDSRFITGLSNTDPVTTWEDRSSSNNDATQGTANDRPLFQTAYQGGCPALQFDGATDHLDFASSIISGTPDGSVVFCFKLDTDPPASATKAGPVFGDFGTAAALNVFPWTDGNIYDDFGSTVRSNAGDPSLSFTTTRVVYQHSATNDWVIFLSTERCFILKSPMLLVGLGLKLSVPQEIHISYMDI
jgi:hypothetical protein